MQVRVQTSPLTAVESDVLVVPLAQGEQESEQVWALNSALHGFVKSHIQRSGFIGKEGESIRLQPQGHLPSRDILLVGLGKRDQLETETWRRVAGRAHKEAKVLGAQQLAWFFATGDSTEATLAAVLEGTLLSGYTFDKYKSEKNHKPVVQTLTLAGPTLQQTPTLLSALEVVQKTATGVFLARDLVNEPASVSTPSYLAEQAARISKGNGIKSDIWRLKQIKAAQMAGLLAVARGSAEEPRFIKLVYKPKGQAKQKIALVGKGLTFDSGGLSLKSAKSMETMKLDMAGGATVLGVMQVIGQLKPPVQVTGYIPATENMPSGTAQKPGDIIRYRNGKTVEVLNTDAEGRLILADALITAAADKPDVIIDLATLTGACVVALGPQIAGLFSNNQDLAAALLRCSQESGEPLWQLPLVKDYKEDLKSTVADIKNTGSGNAGAIAGALFLEEFVGGVPWAHLDIAGPAFAEKDGPYTAKGGTGFGVRTLVRYVLSV
jgi:leucyl aminopeptidase